MVERNKKVVDTFNYGLTAIFKGAEKMIETEELQLDIVATFVARGYSDWSWEEMILKVLEVNKHRSITVEFAKAVSVFGAKLLRGVYRNQKKAWEKHDFSDEGLWRVMRIVRFAITETSATFVEPATSAAAALGYEVALHQNPEDVVSDEEVARTKAQIDYENGRITEEELQAAAG